MQTASSCAPVVVGARQTGAFRTLLDFPARKGRAMDLSMSDASFQIVFRGKILTGFDRDTVRRNLMALFKADAARIDAMLDSPKLVLKSGVSKDVAARYQEALRQAGIMVAVVSEAPPPVAPVQAAAPLPVAAAAPPVAAPSSPAVASVPATPIVPTSVSSAPASAVGAVAVSALSLADGGFEMPAKPHAPEIDTSALSLAEAGERILPAQPKSERHFDLSGLSLAAEGAVLDTSGPIPAPQFDLSELSVAEAGGALDPTPPPPPLRVDTSGLSLVEVSAEELARADQPSALWRELSAEP